MFNCKCICMQGRRSRGNTFATCNRRKGTKESKEFYQVRDLLKHNIHIYHVYVYYICNTSVEQQQQPQKFPLLLFLTSSSSTADCQLRSERERAAPSAQLSSAFSEHVGLFALTQRVDHPRPPTITPCLTGLLANITSFETRTPEQKQEEPRQSSRNIAIIKGSRNHRQRSPGQQLGAARTCVCV